MNKKVNKTKVVVYSRSNNLTTQKEHIKRIEISAWAILDLKYLDVPRTIPIPYITVKKHGRKNNKITALEPFAIFKTEREALTAIALSKKRSKKKGWGPYAVVPIAISSQQ